MVQLGGSTSQLGGNPFDFLCGFIFGFVFGVLFVLLAMLMCRVNRMLKNGLFLGFLARILMTIIYQP